MNYFPSEIKEALERQATRIVALEEAIQKIERNNCVVMSVKDVANFMGVTPAHVYVNIDKGVIPASKITGKIIVLKDDLINLLKEDIKKGGKGGTI